MGVFVKLIKLLNEVLGLLLFIVMYDVIEVFSIVDYVIIIVD